MYEQFFGFRERPFAVAPSAKWYFPGAAAENARQTLSRCAQRAEGVGLLIGAPGTGKSLICQVLAEQFRDSLQVVLLSCGQMHARRDLLQAIAFELNLPYRGIEEGDLRLALIDHLSPRAPDAQFDSAPLLLIIDEAHTLPLRLLEELRLLTNLMRAGQPRVRLMLAGSTQLEHRFASPKLESFNQRIAARCYFEALDRRQTTEYVRHQVQIAGGRSSALFGDDALEALHQATGGFPRLINQVSDHALLLAFAAGMGRLTSVAIEEAWSDLQQLPTPANMASAPDDAAGVVEFGQLDDEPTDGLPAAVPFRNMSSEIGPTGTISLAGQTAFDDTMADDVSDDTFIGIADVGPAFRAVSNPFEEVFDEEEVIIDPYVSFDVDALASRPRVRSPESRELGAMLAPFAFPQAPSVAISAATWPVEGSASVQPHASSQAPAPRKVAPDVARIPDAPHTATAPDPLIIIDDSDLIVIEDDPVTAGTGPVKAPSKVERRPYRQLFAQLRRG